MTQAQRLERYDWMPENVRAEEVKMETASGTKQIPRDNYDQLLQSLRDRFDGAIAEHRHLFTTDAVCEHLFDQFLEALPPEERQHHTCHACRQFVERYGHVVTISPEGQTTPVMWGPARSFYGAAFKAVRTVVARARVIGVFYDNKSVWGTPVTGVWQHMAVTPPEHLVFRQTRLRTARQAMAERREEYKMLQRGLGDFPYPLARLAYSMLQSEALYRNEKCFGVAEWFMTLHGERAVARGPDRKANVVWRAVASAPAGYCHVRSTMIGTLLEDLAANKSPDDIMRAFRAKMHPLQYQRPQAPPKPGNISRAEKVVAELQSAGALERRYARLQELETLWRPTQERAGGGGVFGHLRDNSNDRVELPTTTITWVKFVQTVLSGAQQIEVYVPVHGRFIALCTAVNPDAPPIIQWDCNERRNPVNWYVYNGGSSARQWNLTGKRYSRVTAISLLPHLWYVPERYRHQGEGAVLVVDGCRDTGMPSAALFPEVLRAEYREIRSTIEAHSRSSGVQCKEEASACGIDLRKGARWDCTVRVTSPDTVAVYRLDRWD